MFAFLSSVGRGGLLDKLAAFVQFLGDWYALRKQVAWATIFLAPIMRLFFWRLGWHSIDEYFLCVMDALGCGCLLALYYPNLRRAHLLSHPVATALFTAITGVLAATHHRFAFDLLFMGATPALIALVIFGCVERAYPFLNNRLATWLGTMSYSLYLWQQPFMSPSRHWLTIPVSIGAAVACAWLSYRLVELPMQRFRRKEMTMAVAAT